MQRSRLAAQLLPNQARTQPLIGDRELSHQIDRLVEPHRAMRRVGGAPNDDHIAGNEVFQDCEIIANSLTATALGVISASPVAAKGTTGGPGSHGSTAQRNR